MASLFGQLGVILAPKESSLPNAVRSYLIVSLFYATVWFSRLAMVFTIIRIGSEQFRHRLLAFIAMLFFLFFFILLVQLFWICGPQREVPEIAALAPGSINVFSCVPIRQMGILQISFDAFADLSLLLSSFRLFVIIQHRPLRYRLILLFSTCLLTTGVSAVHVYLILTAKSVLILIAALVEGSVSLIVCSLPIVTNLFVRITEGNSSASQPQPLTITFAPETVSLSSL
ncbi:hypothetical protein NLJ89_g4943 [Agrocybe chaxingu]|uniref:Uncharacterized protein n=1 Tax=Agrocybe chaxingu TaxID=84603 RepID=A0A9W8MW20_9AGAR|nr:hypothetical protein NLJ89_g4943 [Agrocybe chaxingu]